MPFLLHEQPLALDVPFTHDGISYPANWLRLASAEDKAAIGITETPEPHVVDLRFYWGVDNPKDLDGLKAEWVGIAKKSANQQLAVTDWYVIRQMDTGKPIPAEVNAQRAAIRDGVAAKEAAINAVTSVAELEAYVNGGGFFG